MSTPAVTIGLPVYNGAPMVADTLDALLGQTYPDIRLVIGDNASTDATEALCRARAAADPRVEYHRHPANLGPWPNFRFVLEQARTPYFMWASHDDVWDGRYVASCVAALEADAGLGIAFTRFQSVLVRDGVVVRRRVFPSMEPILRLTSGPRLSLFMLLDEFSQKANLIYGVWRTSLARDAMAHFGHMESMVFKGLDIVMLTYALSQRRAVQLEEVLFTQRYTDYLVGSRTSKVQSLLRAVRRPAATGRKAVAFSRDHGRSLLLALEAGGALSPALRAVVRLKQVLYFLPVYRLITSSEAVLLMLRMCRGVTGGAARVGKDRMGTK